MSIIGYQKDFPVEKEFNLTKFVQVLDDEDFHPFILITEEISDWQYRCKFQHIAKLSPIFVPRLRKGNVADEILFQEFIIERLQHDIRITASIGSTTFLLMGIFAVVFTSVAILMRTIFAWIPIALFIGFQSLKYYWDVERFNSIGQIANGFTERAKNEEKI